MKPSQVLLLVGYALGISAGQYLFKRAALELRAQPDVPGVARAALTNLPLLGALLLYGALTGLWVYILSTTPLSRAMPFLALSLVATTAVGALAFGEHLSRTFLVGLAAITVGLCLIALEGPSA